ncbi:MAG: hypothetical protein Kow0092_29690 [Deferrisomatales bacterium]
MRKGSIFVLWITLTVVWSAQAGAQGTLEKIRRAGVLVAGVPDDAPPFGFRDRDSGRIAGYDVDFVTALANRLGVRVRLRAVTEANRLSELLDGRVDLLAAGITHSEARGAVLAFSDHYLVSGQKLIARTGTIRRHEDLEGKRIGAVVGTFAESCARDRCKVSEVVPFDDYIEGVRALQEGKIDAFTADEAILVDLFAGLPGRGYEIPDLLILREEYHLGIRQGDEDLLDFVNQTIHAMQQDGEADRIRRKWYTPREVLPPPAYGSVVRRAAVRPRFLGIVLSGILYPGAEVSLFALTGEPLGAGRIASVLGDEFYVDVEEKIYDLVRPGFLVAMNMNRQMAMDVLMRRRGVLEQVGANARQEEERVQGQKDKEALQKQARATQMDTLRERSRVSVQADRARYFNYYDHGYRRYRH